ncbi:TonB-linked outer membrane protein, SusC/RagA family [Catalinimonas alkaloidigena]|uniref:TonB-linked outer membrane protein, SusC/RagA family n=1 Tax=Catalinimonas alkaloidigena TaxID=1075417 RepID=A0A1G9RHJ1_9BACT|nr:TonB-dependent receptor [Catalinimonas alkaloidigena]SDM21905.1 TonB-linked outer membrane protein, SusC/RagA family [Catalinimonas alkaloidigena]
MKTFLPLVCLTALWAPALSAQHLALHRDKPLHQTQETYQLLPEVLSEIEKKYGVEFVYRRDRVDDLRVRKPDVSHLTLQESLQELLTPNNLEFKQLDDHRYAIISKTLESKSPPRLPSLVPVVPPQPSLQLTPVQRASEISGQVLDASGEGIPGVNVLEKGTQNGTITDVAGRYTLKVSDNPTLVFSAVGYLSQEVAVGARLQIDITLEEDVKALEEIVVVGYGTQKKSDLTGSVAAVKTKDINAFPVTNAVQGLNGRATGVQVVQNSGAPGSTLSVKIRGGNSLQGSNEPLYVVDGFPLTGGIGALNPADIESMEILKDASATAIYGSRGANGVVIITTKRGKSGRGNVSLDSYYGFQSVIKKLDLLNATEFATLMNERASNDGAAPYFTDAEIAGFGAGTDWQEVVFRTAPVQNHVLTLSGGNDRTQYSVSGSLFDQQGIIVNSAYQRASLRANLNQTITDKLSLSYSSILSRVVRNQIGSDNSARGNGVLSAAMVSPPTLAPYRADGTYNAVDTYPFSPNVLQNPLVLAYERYNRYTGNEMLLNTALTFTPFNGLSLRVSAGLENTDSRSDYYASRLLRGSTGSASTSYGQEISFLNENILTYSKTFAERHALTFTGGFTFQNNQYRGTSASSSGYSTDALLNYNLQAGSTPGVPSSSYSDWTILSYLARVNYSFHDRLLITLSGRADGSSRFGQSNKWGLFPSGAIAYRLIEEDFLKNLPQLTDLKVRASWGQTGSTAVSPYQTLNLLSSRQVVFGDDIFVGYVPGSGKPNPDLQWETTQQTDLGLDVGLFNQRLQLTFDVYNKLTTDLLATVPLPNSSGYTSTVRNIGSIRNRGFEASATAILVDKAFKWNATANFSLNRNRVRQLAGGSDVFGGALDIPFNVSVNLIREGLPVGVFYGFREDGLDEAGQIKYVDVNDDGLINDADKTVIGDPNPDFIYGFSTDVSFKNFELSVFLQGIQGADLFNFNTSGLANSFNFGENQIRDILNRWSPQNPDPNAPYPALSVNTKFRESDRYVEDGSFLRVKNIQLAYNLPTRQWNLSWLQSAQLYISGQNLLTFTDYSWYDPEVSTRGSSLTMGIDQAGYPNARTITLGARIGL